MQTHALELGQWLFARGYYVEVATCRIEAGPMELPELIYSSTVYYGELGSMTGVPVFCRSAGNDVLRPWIAWPFVMGSRVLDLPWVERQLYCKWKRWA